MTDRIEMKQPRKYTCFTCKKSFTTKYAKPKCMSCGKTLKGTRKTD